MITSGLLKCTVNTHSQVPARMTVGQYHNSSPPTQLCSLLNLHRDRFLISISHLTLPQCLLLFPYNVLHSFTFSLRPLSHKLSPSLIQFQVLYASNELLTPGGKRKVKRMTNQRRPSMSSQRPGRRVGSNSLEWRERRLALLSMNCRGECPACNLPWSMSLGHAFVYCPFNALWLFML